jgi:hypothetical protein
MAQKRSKSWTNGEVALVLLFKKSKGSLKLLSQILKRKEDHIDWVWRWARDPTSFPYEAQNKLMAQTATMKSLLGPYLCDAIDVPSEPSNANQGWVYFANDVRDKGLTKIGRARDVKRRLRELTKSVYPLELIHQIKCENSKEVELKLHRILKQYREAGTEWFRIPLSVVESWKQIERIGEGFDDWSRFLPKTH